MTRQARTAIAASFAIHVIAFILLTAVRLYYEEVDVKGKMPVAFVRVQEAKPTRRSDFVRPNILLYRSLQSRSQEQAIIRPTHGSSEVFYTKAPQQVFSIASEVEREILKGQIVAQVPTISKPQGMVSPVVTAVFNETRPPETWLLQSITISGRDFLKEIPPLTFDFAGDTLALREVVVYREPVLEATPGRQTMEVSEILRVTGAANDPLRALQILPGINAPNSIMAGLYVRGGGPDDNSYYFDRVYLSYPYHFVGLATTINSAAIESVDVHAGGFGAEFGNAQAVIDIHAKPPEREKFSFTSNLNMIMSELMLESPIGSKGALYVAGRRSYADLVIPQLVDIPELTHFPTFWDYQTGFDYDLTPDQQLHFSAFSTRDSFEITLTEDFRPGDGEEGVDPEFLGESHYITGFDAQSLTLNSSFSERLTLQSTLSRRHYTMDLEIGSGSYYLRENPGFYALREDAEYAIHPRHKIQLGGLLETGDYRIASYFPRLPSAEDMAEGEGRESYGGEEYYGPFGNIDEETKVESDTWERFTLTAGYLQDRIAMTDWLSLKLGTRFSRFNMTDEVMVDPRASLSFTLPSGAKLRAAWGVYHQNPTPAQILPEWGNPDIHSSRANHYVLELERDVPGNRGSLKLAGYYKELSDLVTKHPKDIYLNQGTGHAQGIEMLLKYNPSERFLGWLSYTYSQSRRKDSPDSPERLYIFDQTHVATLSMSYRPTSNWELGLRWNYATGTPIAPSDPGIGDLREPASHRLDLRFARTFLIGQTPLQIYLDVLNAYDYSGSVTTSGEAQEWVEYEEEDVDIPVVPYLGASMKF
jgi:outer membrane receptor protein involved in Fe transport